MKKIILILFPVLCFAQTHKNLNFLKFSKSSYSLYLYKNYLINKIENDSVKTETYIYDSKTGHLEIELRSDSTFFFSGGCFYGVGTGTYTLKPQILLLRFRQCEPDEKSSHDDLCGQTIMLYSESHDLLHYKKIVLKKI